MKMTGRDDKTIALMAIMQLKILSFLLGASYRIRIMFKGQDMVKIFLVEGVKI